MSPEIKDSGARQEFSTGAVRDIQEGKGRNDLLHPVVMQRVMEHFEEFKQYEVWRLEDDELMYACKRSLFDYYGASNNAIYPLLSAYLFGCVLQCRQATPEPKPQYSEDNTMVVFVVGSIELAKHYEKGAKKYGDHNWSKGIPSTSFYDSADRHMNKVILGCNDEPHLSAYMFNVVGLIYNTLFRKELEVRIYAGGLRKNDPQESITSP